MEPAIVHEIAQKVQENVESIDRIPDTYLTDEERAHYRALAQGGKDVYAYPHESSTIWNVWDEDVRIPYGPDPRRWSIQTVTLAPESKVMWMVTLRDQHEQTTRTVLLTCYQPVEAVPRHILATVQFCNTFHIEPIDHSI